jgi:putative transposase
VLWTAEALARPRRWTTKPAPGHKIYPYLLRDITVERPNQVWAADITYIPLGRGFLYLVAIMDWANRAILAWRLSNTMDVSFCVSALEEALAKLNSAPPKSSIPTRVLNSPAPPHRRADRGGDPHLDGRSRTLDG